MPAAFDRRMSGQAGIHCDSRALQGKSKTGPSVCWGDGYPDSAVIPAKAGIHLDPDLRDENQNGPQRALERRVSRFAVIPAKAGIHLDSGLRDENQNGPSLRWGDDRKHAGNRNAYNPRAASFAFNAATESASHSAPVVAIHAST